jgi:eukaryotic-like serine/threonine-protein kinase
LSDLAVGQVLDGYEIIEELGSGGMGTVYKAFDSRLRRHVAIKTLTADAAEWKRFQREARAASALNHPNIITIYSIGEAGGLPFIVMEFVEGETVRDLLRSGVLWRDTGWQTEALRIATEVASGLAAAHEYGIVHRDLKPENVMRSKEGFVKILDFGLAKVVGAPFPNKYDSTGVFPPTTPGTLIGTQGYMSPEQVMGADIDYRSDQFSFGTLLYEMLTGRQPFLHETGAETLIAVLHHTPPPLENVPTPIREVVERCLQKERYERYASTREMASALRHAASELNALSYRAVRGVAARISTASPLARLTGTLIPLLSFIVIAWIWQSQRARDVPPRSYIAVMPFRSAESDAAATRFAEGLSELVSARLAVVPALHVVPSAVVAAATRQSVISEIAGEVGATLLVTGIVERIGATTVVHYSLRDPERNVELTSGRVEVRADDIGRIEERIVEGICMRLGVTHSGEGYTDPVLRSATAQRTYIEALGLISHENDVASLDDAIRRLTPLAEGAPESPLVFAALSRAYLAKFRLRHERVSSDRALSFALRSMQGGRALIGQVHLETGRWKEAMAAFEEDLLSTAPHAMSALNLAKAYEGDGQYEEAIDHYRRAEQSPSAEVHAAIGRCEFLLGNYNRAVNAFTESAKIDPSRSRTWAGLAAAKHFLSADEAEIANLYRRATEVGALELRSTNDVSLSAAMAVWLTVLGDSARANDFLETALQTDRRNPAVLLDAARIAIADGQSDQAVEYLNRAVELGHVSAVILRDPAFRSIQVRVRRQ